MRPEERLLVAQRALRELLLELKSIANIHRLTGLGRTTLQAVYHGTRHPTPYTVEKLLSLTPTELI